MTDAADPFDTIMGTLVEAPPAAAAAAPAQRTAADPMNLMLIMLQQQAKAAEARADRLQETMMTLITSMNGNRGPDALTLKLIEQLGDRTSMKEHMQMQAEAMKQSQTATMEAMRTTLTGTIEMQQRLSEITMEKMLERLDRDDDGGKDDVWSILSKFLDGGGQQQQTQPAHVESAPVAGDAPQPAPALPAPTAQAAPAKRQPGPLDFLAMALRGMRRLHVEGATMATADKLRLQSSIAATVAQAPAFAEAVVYDDKEAMRAQIGQVVGTVKDLAEWLAQDAAQAWLAGYLETKLGPSLAVLMDLDPAQDDGDEADDGDPADHAADEADDGDPAEAASGAGG